MTWHMSCRLFKDQMVVFDVSSLITDDDLVYMSCHLYKDQTTVWRVSSLITDDDITFELSSS